MLKGVEGAKAPPYSLGGPYELHRQLWASQASNRAATGAELGTILRD